MPTNIVKIEIPAVVKKDGGETELRLIMVPYYAWNNRGNGSMMVWLPVKHSGTAD